METDAVKILAQLALDVAHLGNQLAGLKESLNPRALSAHQEVWLQTQEATQALKTQGIRSPEELRELVRWGVLPIDNEHIRDASLSPGRPKYEFNIPKCTEQIAWWKALSATERKQLIERRKVA